MRQLYGTVSPQILQTYRFGYYATWAERPSGDAVIATQGIARRIALLYRLDVGSVVVSFVSHLKRPGQIELSNSNDFFIELHSEYRHRYEQIAAILAHEVAHIFCHRLKMSIGSTFEDEVMTDTTAAYLGAGVPILNAFTEESDFTQEAPNRFRQLCFGYITPAEFGYVLEKRRAAIGDDPVPFLTSKPGIAAYDIGAARARQELLLPPLSTAGIGARAAYRINRYVSARNGQRGHGSAMVLPLRSRAYEFETAERCSVLFDCPTCFQRLRLPTHRKKISVKCPVCRGHFLCAT